MTTIVPALPPEDVVFLEKCAPAAAAGGHVWPDFAACEAALESGYGRSTLARADNNLFGMKQHKHPVFGTATLPTEEFLQGQWVRVNADWVKYPALADCFRDRMDTLRRLAPQYAHYAAALSAQDGATFLREVSKTWSTDPNRAQKALDIYRRWKRL
jgi:flagellum-specific peptidoglycan hydrolase FlgJ